MKQSRNHQHSLQPADWAALSRLALLTILIFSQSTAFLNSQIRIQNLFFGAEFAMRADFRGGAPVFTQQAFRSQEGLGHWEDANGDLLFWYAWPQAQRDTLVVDRNGQPMPGSRSMQALGSTTESAVCPVPGSPDRYYIFHQVSTDFDERIANSFFYYSTVDMAARGGAGDVVESNVLLDDSENQHEGLEVVAVLDPCTKEVDFYWLLRFNLSRGLVARRIDEDGIHDEELLLPWTAPPEADGRGELEYYRGKLGVALNSSGVMLLADFDPWRGIVRNAREIRLFPALPLTGPYGLEFSPDTSKVYVTRWRHSSDNILQYDLDDEQFRFYDYDLDVGQVELGPDDKLYFASTVRILVVDDPNQRMPPLREIAMPRDQTFLIAEGVTDPVQYYDALEGIEPPVIRITGPQEICPCGDQTLQSPAGFVGYEWQPGGASTASLQISRGGDYSVTVTDEFGCRYTSEPFSVRTLDDPGILSADTLKLDPDEEGILTLAFRGSSVAATCPPRPFRVTLVFRDAVLEVLELMRGGRIETDDSSNGERRLTISGSGREILEEIRLRGLRAADNYSLIEFRDFEWTDCPITVSEIRAGAVAVTPDLQVLQCACGAEGLELRAPEGFAAYRWEPGNAETRVITATESAEYHVTVTNDIGCEFRSEGLRIDLSQGRGSLMADTVASSPGSNVGMPLILQRPPLDACPPRRFRVQIQFNQYVLELLTLLHGSRIVSDENELELRRITIEGQVSGEPALLDTLEVLEFLTLVDAQHTSDVRILGFEWLDCSIVPAEISDGLVDLGESVCLPHRLQWVPIIPRLRISGPHPLIDQSEVEYIINVAGPVRLLLYDALGVVVQTLVDEELAAGTYKLPVSSAGLANGHYLLRLEAADGTVAVLRLTIAR